MARIVEELNDYAVFPFNIVYIIYLQIILAVCATPRKDYLFTFVCCYTFGNRPYPLQSQQHSRSVSLPRPRTIPSSQPLSAPSSICTVGKFSPFSSPIKGRHFDANNSLLHMHVICIKLYVHCRLWWKCSCKPIKVFSIYKMKILTET